jgi:hypothetical protein
MIIAIDFDGTCVTHEYPEVGKDIGAGRVLKKLAENGHQLILWTMRSGKELQDAEDWFYAQGFYSGYSLFGVNSNPQQASWTSSPKAYAQMYIDDAALGCPLIYNCELSSRPFVDWIKIEQYLQLKNII